MTSILPVIPARSSTTAELVKPGSSVFVSKELDFVRLLPHALRAVRYASVRSGILPSQSGFRRNDDYSESAT